MDYFVEISIVTPCYNLEKYIAITYQFICAQTINWEWIIVDDGSNDDTVRIIEGLNDDRIKLLTHRHIGNLSVLRNHGASHAKGKIIAFLDGDDWYSADGLRIALEYFSDNPEIDFCHTDTMLFIEETSEYIYANKKHKLRNIKGRRQYLGRLLRSNPITVSSIFMRADVFARCGGFNVKMTYCEDLELWIRLLSEGFNIGFINEPIVVYRVRSSSLFNSKRIKYLKTNFLVYKLFLREHPFQFLTHLCSIMLFYSNNYFFIYKCLLESGKKARKYFWLSVLFDPRKLRYVKNI